MLWEDIKTLFKHFGMIFFAVTMLFPFLWMLGASLKPRDEIHRIDLLPENAKPINYADPVSLLWLFSLLYRTSGVSSGPWS